MAKIIAEIESPRLFLRVSETSNDEPGFHFDIAVNAEDRKWYINVPYPKRSYRIDLCISRMQKIKILGHSNTIRMPSQYLELSEVLPQVTKSLLILSGSEELHLVEPQVQNSMRIMGIEE